MESAKELHLAVRREFPAISSAADLLHEKRWGSTLGPDFEYAWFEALADAMNAEIVREAPCALHLPLFRFMERAFFQGSDAVKNCVDTAFVENLFWQLSSLKCAPYWHHMPPKLKQLYTDFHGHAP